MTIPYLTRFCCLCLASFFLLHLGLGLLVRLIAPWVIRMAGRMDAGMAGRWLLALRLTPAGLGALVVAGICAPSYLWLEPAAGDEEMGWVCLLAATFGLIVVVESLSRGLLAYGRSSRYIRACQNQGRQIHLDGAGMPVWVVDGNAPLVAPLVALTGILSPRLLLSQEVAGALASDQLDAVLRHERAHRISRDNFKRLLILLSPPLLPFYGGFSALESAWALAAEWAADDHAAGGSRLRALALASALVCVARLKAPQTCPLLATSLLANGAELSARVNRLLRPAPHREAAPANPILKAAVGWTLAAGMAGVMLQPSMFRSVHEILEDLIR